jgi:hypothetical protein
MNPMERVVLLVWPSMVGVMLMVAWLRFTRDLQGTLIGSLVDSTFPFFVPVGALMIFFYLLRGGLWARSAPQKLLLSTAIAALTLPVVLGSAFFLATILFGS